MAKLLHAEPADVAELVQKSICVLGYGSQGRAQALNLRDSGCQVRVAARSGRSWERAKEDGFQPVTLQEGAASQVLAFCLPDIESGRVYSESIAPQVASGTTLVFAHGFAVHGGLIVPAGDLDVVLVAPMGAGPVVRKRFEEGSGVPGLIAVHQDVSGRALATAAAYGEAIGCGRVAMLQTSFREETESDLFAEQAVLCGGLPELMRAAYRTLVNGGIQPEIAYISCVHEVKLIVDLIYEQGLDGMVRNISQTAEWGAYRTGTEVIGEPSRDALENALSRIQSGSFTKEWIDASRAGLKALENKREVFLRDPIHEVGSAVRSLMGITGRISASR